MKKGKYVVVHNGEVFGVWSKLLLAEQWADGNLRGEYYVALLKEIPRLER